MMVKHSVCSGIGSRREGLESSVVRSTHCCCRDLSPVPRTHTRWLTIACDSSAKRSEALLAPVGKMTHTSDPYSPNIYVHTHNLKMKIHL